MKRYTRWLPTLFCGLACMAGVILMATRFARNAYAQDRPPALPTGDQAAAKKVLIFSRTKGFRHGSIPVGNQMLQELARELGVESVVTEDPALFNAAALREVRLVIFNNTTGDVLNREQEQVFEAYIRGGGAFVGIHAATDTEYDWAFYGELVGAYFANHPKIQEATLRVADVAHPSTQGLERVWVRKDEWYNFREEPAPGVERLVMLDEGTYKGGKMGVEHPVSWCQVIHGGRSWYTAMGHTKESYAEPAFRAHVKGGLAWAMEILTTATPPVAE